MKQIRWLDTDPVGINAIDTQHRRIVDGLNLAIGACNDRRIEDCVSAIRGVLKTTRRHFRQEEALLRRDGFLGIEDHAAYHARLLSEVEKVGRVCNSTRDWPFIEARLAEMAHFLLNEIRVSDRAIVKQLNTPAAAAE